MDVTPNNDLNSAAYGKANDFKAILADGGRLSEAKALRSMLTEAVKQSWSD
jgi:hypothetical protein